MNVNNTKVNCWEFLNCGREPGGANLDEHGPCPASTFEPAHGYLGGKNGGRACAFIVGTFCSRTLKGTCRDTSKHCINCAFFHHMKKETKEAFSFQRFNLFIHAKANRKDGGEKPVQRYDPSVIEDVLPGCPGNEK